jgi:signal transduction histidine kinase
LKRPDVGLAIGLALAASLLGYVTSRVLLEGSRSAFVESVREHARQRVRHVNATLARDAEQVAAELARLAEQLGDELSGRNERLDFGASERWVRRTGLDMLVILDGAGKVLSSAPWPERAGLDAPELRRVAGGPAGPSRIRDAAGTRLAVVSGHSVDGEQGASWLIGGRRLDRGFLERAAGGGAAILLDFDERSEAPLMRTAGAGPELDAWIAVGRDLDVGGEATLPGESADWIVARRTLEGAGDEALGALVVAEEIAIGTLALRSPGAVAAAIAVLAGLVGAVCGLWLARASRHPVRRLVRAVDAIAAGTADYTFPHSPRDETEELQAAFSRLQRSLDNQRARALAAERVAAWREVARHVAHEVKNPLVPIRLTVENLMRARGRDPRLFDELFDEGARTILEEVEQLRRLVGEFSEFARLPAPVRRTVGVGELVDGVVELFRAEPGLRIARRRDGDRVELELDADQIARALKNVLGNAVEALRDLPEDRRRIEVRTDATGDPVEITISDNGPGFEEETVGRVFEPYFTTKREGTGLGMAIAARIVAGHGGWMTAGNREGGGAEVVIRLPVVGSERTDAGEPRGERA